jgi:hypothetical protein
MSATTRGQMDPTTIVQALQAIVLSLNEIIAATGPTSGLLVFSGATATRPTSVPTGFPFFDTTLGIPVWWSGAAWVNASGASV